MKKTVYYVEGLAHNDGFCDEFGFTFDLEEAKKNADYYYSHLTSNEQKGRRVSIVGHEVEAIGSAKESLEAFDEGHAFRPDPQFFEIIHE